MEHKNKEKGKVVPVCYWWPGGKHIVCLPHCLDEPEDSFIIYYTSSHYNEQAGMRMAETSNDYG